jgi:hypothetical protein
MIKRDSVTVHLSRDTEVAPFFCPHCARLLNKITMQKQLDPEAILVTVCAYCAQASIIENGEARKPRDDELPEHVLDAVAIMQKSLRAKQC